LSNRAASADPLCLPQVSMECRVRRGEVRSLLSMGRHERGAGRKLQVKESAADSDGDGLGAATGAQFYHDVLEMHLYGLYGNEEFHRNVAIAIVARDLLKHFSAACSARCAASSLTSGMVWKLVGLPASMGDYWLLWHLCAIASEAHLYWSWSTLANNGNKPGKTPVADSKNM
jgi:hypothetical protein